MIHELFIKQIHSNIHGSVSSRNASSHKIHRLVSKQVQNIIYSTSACGVYSFEDGNVVNLNNKNICCSYVCRLCAICIHCYWCTCYDNAIKTLICKHIHNVAINNSEVTRREHINLRYYNC